MLEWLQFSSLKEFVEMGKHGVYVWSAYGIFFVVIIVNLLTPYLQKKRFWLEQQRRLRREQLGNKSLK